MDKPLLIFIFFLGVVGLKELRAGIENVNAGNVTNNPQAPATSTTDTKTEATENQHEIKNDLDLESNNLKNDNDDEDDEDESDFSDTEMLPNKPNEATTENEIGRLGLSKRKISL